MLFDNHISFISNYWNSFESYFLKLIVYIFEIELLDQFLLIIRSPLIRLELNIFLLYFQYHLVDYNINMQNELAYSINISYKNSMFLKVTSKINFIFNIFSSPIFLLNCCNLQLIDIYHLHFHSFLQNLVLYSK